MFTQAKLGCFIVPDLSYRMIDLSYICICLFKQTPMDDIVIPYRVPEQEEHSFFFIDQRIKIELEAKYYLQIATNP